MCRRGPHWRRGESEGRMTPAASPPPARADAPAPMGPHPAAWSSHARRESLLRAAAGAARRLPKLPRFLEQRQLPRAATRMLGRPHQENLP